MPLSWKSSYPLIAWGLSHLSRKPVPQFEQPLIKKLLSDVQFETPLVELWDIPTCPVTGYLGDQHLLLHFSSSRGCRERWGCPLAFFSPSWTNPKSSDTSHRTCLSALSLGLLLSSGRVKGPSHPSWLVWGSELRVRPLQHWTQQDNFILRLIGCAVFDVPQAGGFPLGCQGSADSHWASCWPAPPSLYRAALKSLLSHVILVFGISRNIRLFFVCEFLSVLSNRTDFNRKTILKSCTSEKISADFTLICQVQYQLQW